MKDNIGETYERAVSKTISVKLLRDGVECIIMGLPEHTSI